MVRAGRPRSRVGLARNLMRANGLPTRATPSHNAPNRPLLGSVPSCHLWCGRDARVPGWVWLAALCVQTASDPGLLPRTARQTGLSGVLFRRATCGAGGTPAFPGGSRSQAYACKRPPIQGHSLAWRAKPALAGFCSVVPLMVRAGRPRSRVGLARSLMRANGLPTRAGPSPSAPNLPLRGSVPSCHLWCGRDARVPGWVSLAAFCVQTVSDPGLLPCTARQTGLSGDLFRRGTFGAGGTPAFPGGSRSQPYACKRPPIQGHSPARCAKPALAGICSVVPFMVRAGRPRSRVGLARSLMRANGLPSRAVSSHGAPDRPLRGSVSSCHLWCGRDARVPGWIWLAALCVQTASQSGLLPRMARQTGLSGVLFRRATYGAGGTPAFPGGSGPQAYACKRPPIQGCFLARRARPAFTGFCSVVALLVRAGRPRSRVGLARSLLRANGLRSRATPSHGALDRP